jgi:hypothetical protein
LFRIGSSKLHPGWLRVRRQGLLNGSHIEK